MLYVDEAGQIFEQGSAGLRFLSGGGQRSTANEIADALRRALGTATERASDFTDPFYYQNLGRTPDEAYQLSLRAQQAQLQDQFNQAQYNRAIELLGLDANFDTDSVLDNLNETLPGIRDNFAARGLGNSGFTTQALDTQRRAAQRQLDAIQLAYDRGVFAQPVPQLTTVEDILLEALG